MLNILKNPNTHLLTKQLGNKFGKITEYTVNRKKFHFFPVTINNPRNENLKMILFTIASVRINHLGINSTQKMQDVYIENYKTWLKEGKQDLYKRTGILCP